MGLERLSSSRVSSEAKPPEVKELRKLCNLFPAHKMFTVLVPFDDLSCIDALPFGLPVPIRLVNMWIPLSVSKMTVQFILEVDYNLLLQFVCDLFPQDFKFVPRDLAGCVSSRSPYSSKKGSRTPREVSKPFLKMLPSTIHLLRLALTGLGSVDFLFPLDASNRGV